ncbi:MAG: 30S ribosomal protein S20 [Elusimicrobia bacterium]|jgi:small subunit ribosomal protein S20|nr:30S ribosomal protein S20 [Elusimicrobiota bacterium]
MTKLPTGRHTQAMKASRQSEKKRLRNKSYRSRVNTALKKINILIKEGNKDEALKILDETKMYVDKAVTKNIIHKNKAARLKSRMAKKLNSLS